MIVLVRQSVFSLLALVFSSLFITAHADTSPIGVALDQRVIDLTNTLDSGTVLRLKQQLADLEQRKGAQVAVLLVPTTGSSGIEDYANQLFRAWKLGRKDVNDGILLVVAKPTAQCASRWVMAWKASSLTCWPIASLKNVSLQRFVRAILPVASSKA